ncbi:MAG: anthranilate synthase component I family protein [Bacteroidia bacterium]|nr:anthranilate synthase component I family protein [Bacteroidia bacterium]
MNPFSLLNFLYVPHSGKEGELFELTESTAYEHNSVILIPYQNPQTSKIQPRFFKTTNRQDYVPVMETVKASDILIRARTSRNQYLENVIALKQHIQRGNIYEINYCMEFYAENVSIDPFSIFQKLYDRSKAPYSALLKMGDEFIICTSPELFLKKEGDILSSKPIKGTAKRGGSPEEDRNLKEQLHNSLKERTENVMAVDVARNDLSILAQKGSVHVNELYNIESFETVHQMVSTVSCRLKPGLSFSDIIAATFPMASMTGAPKLRAMTLTDEFENFKRNYYSGTLGIVDEKNDFRLWVIIRSIFYNAKTKQLSIAVGSAITYLSEPEKEYDECLLKAAAMLEVLNARL